MKLSLTNTSEVDITVDVKGNNDPRDKVIIHPRTNTKVDVPEKLFTSIKGIPGLSVQSLKGN